MLHVGERQMAIAQGRMRRCLHLAGAVGVVGGMALTGLPQPAHSGDISNNAMAPMVPYDQAMRAIERKMADVPKAVEPRKREDQPLREAPEARVLGVAPNVQPAPARPQP